MQEEGRSALTQGDIKRPLSPPLPPIKPLPCHKMASFTGLGNDRGGGDPLVWMVALHLSTLINLWRMCGSYPHIYIIITEKMGQSFFVVFCRNIWKQM